MLQTRLSNVELYYALPEEFSKDFITLKGEEYFHAVKVMRNRKGDNIFVTNGNGIVIRGEIEEVFKDKIVISKKGKFNYTNELANVYFCLPKLKSPDRFKFALEKCVELGVTNFIIFDSKRTVAKSGKIERWEKITLSAMKQSIRAFLPQIKLIKSLQEIMSFGGEVFLFDQMGSKNFSFKNDKKKNYYFIFGPEGGFTEEELNYLKGKPVYSVSNFRLRTETAVVKVASLL